MSFLQRLIVYLGHPIHAVCAVVIAAAGTPLLAMSIGFPRVVWIAVGWCVVVTAQQRLRR